MEDYDIITRLGGGTFADVYQALEKSTKTFVAIKTLKKKYSKWEDCLELRECKSLQKLHAEHLSSQPGYNHIIKLKQIIFIKETGTLNLVFEYMDEDLYELMKNQSPRKMSENQIRSIVYQTLLGLQFMHKYGFFHRDMKPENLLRINETIKIADFGLAREIRSMPPYTEYVSTRYYRAPECILKSTNYNSPIDIWALGCIMAEMYLHPQPLFFGNNEKEVLYKICSILGTPNHNTWNEGIQQAKMVNIKLPNFTGIDLKTIIPQACDDAIDLMKLMLQWDPNKRATANNLLNHRFFTNYTISNIISNPDGISQKNKFDRKLSIRSGRRISNHGFIDYRKNSISRILEDNEGFESLINKLKNEIKEEDAALEKEKGMLDEEIEKELDDENDDFNNLIIDDKKVSYGKNENKNEFDYKKSNPPYKSIHSEGNINYNNNFNFNNKNKNIGITLDFDTDYKLKPTTNNTRERSAKRFLENTENEMNAKFSSIPNRFNTNEFVSITPNNKNFSNQFKINNDMQIGEMNFNRRENNNKNNNNNSNNNEILFGMESRRGKHK